MMTAIKETKLAVPADLVIRSCGIALDMGGSVFKAIYRTREDLEDAEKSPNGISTMTLLAVSGDRVEEAVHFLAARSVIDAKVSDNVIYTTGLGCSTNRRLLRKILNISKVESMTEFDCFVKSFHYLAANLSRSQLFYPVDVSLADRPLTRARKFCEIFHSMKEDGKSAMGGMDFNEDLLKGVTLVTAEDAGETKNESSLPVAEVEKDFYPCVLAMCGSGYGYMKVDADGSFTFIDGSASGGRNFLGLGCLLAGVKTYDELLDLACKGDPKAVNTFAEELFEEAKSPPPQNGHENEEEEEAEDPFYSRFANMEGTVFYCFGKCVGKSLADYRREDLARGLLEKWVIDTTHLTTIMCRLSGMGRVFFAGSYFNHPLVRSLTTSEFISRNLFNSMIGQKPLKFDFLRPGPQLGAIGALLTHFEKFVTGGEKPSYK